MQSAPAPAIYCFMDSDNFSRVEPEEVQKLREDGSKFYMFW